MLIGLALASQLALAAAPPGDAPTARVPAGARLLTQAEGGAPSLASPNDPAALEARVAALNRQIRRSGGPRLSDVAWGLSIAGGAGTAVFGGLGLWLIISAQGTGLPGLGLALLGIVSLGVGALAALVLVAGIIVAIVAAVSPTPTRQELIQERDALQKELDSMQVAPPALIQAPGATPLQLVTVAAF